jgi:hypothetical protein
MKHTGNLKVTATRDREIVMTRDFHRLAEILMSSPAGGVE